MLEWLGPARDALAGLGLLGIPGVVVLWWLRDRRKDRAVATVAERTVDAEVVTKDVGGWQAQLAYVSAAFDRERKSLTDSIDARDDEINRLRAEGQHKDEVIALLRVQVEQLGEQLSAASRQLVAVRAQLEELTDEKTHNPETEEPR